MIPGIHIYKIYKIDRALSVFGMKQLNFFSVLFNKLSLDSIFLPSLFVLYLKLLLLSVMKVIKHT